MNFHIITLFPGVFEPYINSSILGRAVRDGRINVKFYFLRDFAVPKNKRVDDRPYGGGPGMVLEALPVLKAVAKARGRKKKVKILITAPSGKLFTGETARKWSKDYTDIIIICGRYEGIDARVKKILRAEEVSIGPYVLSGGEIPAMAMMDAVARQIRGVLGNIDSLEEDRISSTEVYTRPEVFKHGGKNYRVPKVLLTGHHKNIDAWRKERD